MMRIDIGKNMVGETPLLIGTGKCSYLEPERSKMIDVDLETKDEEGNYRVDLRLPCGAEITVLVPSEDNWAHKMVAYSSAKPFGLNLVGDEHYA